METNFQKWLVDHIPDEKMLYRNRFSNYIVFWRDRILDMFYKSYDWDKTKEQKLLDEYNKNIEIVGTHWSKSIEHPVVRLRYKGVEIVFRNNFYDYEIAIVGDIPLDIPMKGLFGSKSFSNDSDMFEHGYCYQGFPDEYKLKTYYEDNKCQFMACLFNDYQFFTFMYLLKLEIDKKAR